MAERRGGGDGLPLDGLPRAAAGRRVAAQRGGRRLLGGQAEGGGSGPAVVVMEEGPAVAQSAVEVDVGLEAVGILEGPPAVPADVPLLPCGGKRRDPSAAAAHPRASPLSLSLVPPPRCGAVRALRGPG